MQVLTTHVLVIGSGAAGMRAALEARRAGSEVLLICKRRLGRSGNTVVAVTNFAAYVPGVFPEDSVEAFIHDTMAGGRYINRHDLVETLANESGRRVMELEQWGVQFFTRNGRLAPTQSPGHSFPRSYRLDTSQQPPNLSGLALTNPLAAACRKAGVCVLENMVVIDFLVDGQQVIGALAFDRQRQEFLAVASPTIVLAGGGGTALFKRHNNTTDLSADSYALALRAGLELVDLEFVQFFPTMVFRPLRLTMETTMFGFGAVLRNCAGEAFMHRYDPVRGNMATRDTMVAAIFNEVREGRGVEDGVWLDCREMGARLDERYGHLVKSLADKGIDLHREPVIVTPAAHHIMGGVVIDPETRTDLAGLFVAGEAAGGVHGANRLGGNALTETQVFGARAGLAAAGVNRQPKTQIVLELAKEQLNKLPPAGSGRGNEVAAQLRQRIKEIVWKRVAVGCEEAGLLAARTELELLADEWSDSRPQDNAVFLPWWEVGNLLLTARAMVEASLCRRESRGSFIRLDFPQEDHNWLGNVFLRYDGGQIKSRFQPLPKPLELLSEGGTG